MRIMISRYDNVLQNNYLVWNSLKYVCVGISIDKLV